MNLLQFLQSAHAASPHFVLIGNPIAHSLSPIMHNTAADSYQMPVKYHAIQVERDELPSLPRFLENPMLKGANVTIPYKKEVLDFVDQLSDPAREIGAINTIVKQPKKLVGYNTDVEGFILPLGPFRDELKKAQALVFGTGGAARAIIFGLMELGVQKIWLVSRNPHLNEQTWPKKVQLISYDDWTAHAKKIALIVNATPLGMAPNEGRSPVKPSQIYALRDKICYDIVYNPVDTPFLKQAETANARTIGGLEMLIQQGSRSFELWTGKSFPIKKVRNRLIKQLNHADKND